MVKLVFCLRRQPHLSLAEFQSYWRDTHGPLVRSHAEVLRIKKYIQVHTTDSPVNAAVQASRGGPEPYDGVAELWWESTDAIVAGTSSEEGQRAALELLEDEKRFIDLANSPLWIADEHQVI